MTNPYGVSEPRTTQDDLADALSGKLAAPTPEHAQVWITQALANGDTEGAQKLMQQYGITQDQINSRLGSTAGRNTGGLYGVLDKTVRPVGQYVTDHPAALFAAPFLAAGALGAFGGAAAGGSAAAAPEAGLSEVAVPSAGAYLPAESLSTAAAPSLEMAAPTAESVGAGTGSSGGWFSKIANMMGNSDSGQQPQSNGVNDQIAQMLASNRVQMPAVRRRLSDPYGP